MTSPTPEFSHFLDRLDRQLGRLDSMIKMAHSKPSDIDRELILKIQKIREDLQAKKNERAESIRFASSVFELNECIRLLSKDQSSDHQTIDRLAREIFNHFKALKDFAEHYREFVQTGLLHHHQETWAQNELIILAREGDTWAVESLLHLMQKGDLWAMDQFFILMTESEDFVYVFSESCSRNRDFKSLISDLFQTSNLMMRFQEIITEGLRKGTLKPSFFDFIAGILVNESCVEHFYTYLLDKLFCQEAVALEIFVLFFIAFKEPEALKKNTFYQHLIQAAKGDIRVQVLLIIITKKFVYQEKICGLIDQGLESIVLEQGQLAQLKLISLSVACEGIVHDIENLEKSTLASIHAVYRLKRIKTQIFSGDYFSFSLMPFHYQLGLIVGLMMRKLHLIQYFLKEASFSIEEPLHDELTTKSKQILMSTANNERILTEQLASKLGSEGVAVRVLAPESYSFNREEFEKSPGLHLIPGTLAPTRWVRDYVFEFQKSYRLPPFMTLPRDVRDAPNIERGTYFPFTVMGSVQDDSPQLYLFEYLEQIDRSLGREKKQVSFQFLNYEGGNVIFGRSRGENYVVTGKDALRINRTALQYELAELGVKWLDGRWILSEPYHDLIRSKEHFGKDKKRTYEENQKVLPPIRDEQLIELMRVDFSCSQIHLVEQPEYHLDVACTLVDSERKRVFINDAALAHKAMMRYIEEIKDEISEHFLPTIHDRLRKSETFIESSKKMEDLCALDFQNQGFEVIRIPGIFSDLHEKFPEMNRINFFNSMFYTNKENETCILALGCPPFFQKLYRDLLQEHMPHIKDIFFVDEKTSKALLSDEGGLHCIMRFLAQEDSK